MCLFVTIVTRKSTENENIDHPLFDDVAVFFQREGMNIYIVIERITPKKLPIIIELNLWRLFYISLINWIKHIIFIRRFVFIIFTDFQVLNSKTSTGYIYLNIVKFIWYSTTEFARNISVACNNTAISTTCCRTLVFSLKDVQFLPFVHIAWIDAIWLLQLTWQ